MAVTRSILLSVTSIYNLINDLNEATTLIASDTHLAQERETLASYDLVYKGDFNQWRKFANSLKLRIAVRISSVEPVMARSLAGTSGEGWHHRRE